MSLYLSLESIERLDRDLRVYDVDQSGWEHEGLDFEFNAAHVQKNLSRDLSRKDLFDKQVVEQEVAPDSVQYALRLARWAGIKRDLVSPRLDAEQRVDKFSGQMRIAAPRIGAYILASSWLADFSHNVDHESTRQEAISKRTHVAQSAGQMLVYSAQLSAVEFGFHLESAFNHRLANLRERFGIPMPTTT